MSKGEARVPRTGGHEPLIDCAGINKALLSHAAGFG